MGGLSEKTFITQGEEKSGGVTSNIVGSHFELKKNTLGGGKSGCPCQGEEGRTRAKATPLKHVFSEWSGLSIIRVDGMVSIRRDSGGGKGRGVLPGKKLREGSPHPVLVEMRKRNSLRAEVGGIKGPDSKRRVESKT